MPFKGKGPQFKGGTQSTVSTSIFCIVCWLENTDGYNVRKTFMIVKIKLDWNIMVNIWAIKLINLDGSLSRQALV